MRIYLKKGKGQRGKTKQKLNDFKKKKKEKKI